MLGAIIGDIVGSPYEFGSDKRKDFPLFRSISGPTDDSVMTVAVAIQCAHGHTSDEELFKRGLRYHMRLIGRQYPDAGYGGMFYDWLMSDTDAPYGSYGNGSAMRVSPVAWIATSLEEAETLAKWSAEVTHDDPRGVRGAQAVAAAIYLARTGESKDAIRAYIEEHYYMLDFTVDEIRPTYRFDVTCDGSVPQAIVAFLDANGFEDAIRNAVSLGGDCDTQACITGAIAEAYYGLPDGLWEQTMYYIDESLQEHIDACSEIIYDA